MNTQEKLDIVKHIKLGTSEVLYYPYNRGEQPLPLRPISSWELDQCFYNSLLYAENKIANLVINLRLGMIDKDRLINVSNDGYAKLLEFYNNVNYWIVYYGMKDFQDEDFSKPNYDDLFNHPNGFYLVKKMQEVHEIADFITTTSNQSEVVLKEIFKNEYGREVAYLCYYLKIPLADIKDLTKLQRDYLIYANGNIDKIREKNLKEKSYSISGKTMSIEEFRKAFGV